MAMAIMSSLYRNLSVLLPLLLLLARSTQAFPQLSVAGGALRLPTAREQAFALRSTTGAGIRSLQQQQQRPKLPLYAQLPEAVGEDEDDNRHAEPQSPGLWQRCRPWLPFLRHHPHASRIPSTRHRFTLRRVTTAAAAALVGTTLGSALCVPQAAHASAPVMALPKAEGRDPASEALLEAERRQIKVTQQELQDMAATARKIEATQGEAARVRYEHEYQEAREAKAARKKADLEALRRELLDQGIDPFTDIEGKRQVIAFEKGVDLGKIPGTPFHLEKEFERSSRPQRSFGYKKVENRKIIACMVQDLKNRGLDPLEYFRTHGDKAADILDLPAPQAASLAQQYQANLEAYGQIRVPQEGEVSAKERLAQAAANDPSFQEQAKAQAKALKAQAKQAKADIKAKAQEAKRVAKEEAQRIKAEMKAAKQAEKDRAKAVAAGAATAVAGASTAVGSAVDQGAEMVQEQVAGAVETLSPGVDGRSGAGPDSGEDWTLPQEVMDGAPVPTASSTSLKGKIQTMPLVPVSAFVVAAGGGVAFKVYRDKQTKEEEERQRQFKLLMGDDDDIRRPSKMTPTSAPALEEIESNVPDMKQTEKPKAKEEPPRKENAATKKEETPVAPKKTKRIGLTKVFSKKKNARETDLKALLADDATAPNLAELLAKTLTFGAPGRFPKVVGLPGGMPMETFDLELAKEKLIAAQTDSGLSLKESAEVFANVVNCMLIDIVDLASTSLKEKDDKLTVDAINIVVDFMNHAASLYDSVAEGVVITPVTYGGSLSKSKLEQMYTAYAVSGMTNMANLSDDFENRVALLQDVFQINEKKAEGLMMKAVQKNMMNMLKDGEGMEGMEDMLKEMGGMEGMGDMASMMGPDGEGPNPEQLKEMLLSLKQLKDSGSIPPDELDAVKSQFKEAFGSGIDEVMKDADAQGGELTSDDKELLDLMKSILDG
jgi:F0F1-type ATP synthase membrane subunit b/b'